MVRKWRFYRIVQDDGVVSGFAKFDGLLLIGQGLSLFHNLLNRKHVLCQTLLEIFELGCDTFWGVIWHLDARIIIS